MAHLPLYVAFLSPFDFAIQSNEKVVLSKFYFNAINATIPRVGMFYFCVCIKIAGAWTEWSTICKHCGVSQTEMLTIRLKLQWSTFPRVQLSISETMITRRWRIKTSVVTHITITSNEHILCTYWPNSGNLGHRSVNISRAWNAMFIIVRSQRKCSRCFSLLSVYLVIAYMYSLWRGCH